jgi:hypothetical protein
VPAPRVCRWTHPSKLGLGMIIVSESSAKATQPVRTGRYTPPRRRSSTAHHDAPRHAKARLISVHTEVLAEPLPLHRPRDCPPPLRAND